MFRTIVSLILFALSSLTIAEAAPWPEKYDPARINADDFGGRVMVASNGKGTAEIIISGIQHIYTRPSDALYCLAKVGPGWPSTGGDHFLISRMPCGEIKNGLVKITYQWPDYKSGQVGTFGYVPITVRRSDGKIYAWEQKPSTSGMATASQFKSKITGHTETVIGLHLNADGTVRFATWQEAEKDIRD